MIREDPNPDTLSRSAIKGESVHRESDENGLELPLVPPLLSSERLRLREVRPDDYPFLYHLAASPSESHLWRFRGAQPSYEEFAQTVKRGVFVQFLIVSKRNQDRLGLVSCYNADFRNRNAYIAMQGSPDLPDRSWIMEAGRLFVDYLFGCFDFEKLYAEAPAFTFDRFRAGLGKFFAEEGRLRGHERFMGRWWDLHILALYRSTWSDHIAHRQFRSTSEVTAKGQDGGPVPLQEFVDYLTTELGVEDGRNADIDLDLASVGFDSVRMYELLMAVEDLGVELNEASLSQIGTLRQAYEVYCRSLDSGRH